MDANGLRPDAVRQLFGQLMMVNPSVEVYLLDNQGRIKGDDAPAGHVKRDQVDLAPIRQFIAGDALPILGDDPRSVDGKKVFSAAPLQLNGQPPSGYIYVVLLGEEHDALAARVAASSVLRTTLWSMALVALLGLLAGLTAFGLITRPLRRLTDAMRRFDADGEPDTQPAVPRSSPAGRRDEIGVLEATFAQMANRIGEQWRALTRQDQQRRELIANISHDLRTPLTSLHGYLETLSLKAETLGETERKRYLAIALAQSVKVGRLAQALFELARLEHGNVQPALEQFSLVDLVQDVFQKFELPAEARHIQLRADIPPRLPSGLRRPGDDRARADEPARQRDSPHTRRRVDRRRSRAQGRQGIGHGQRHRSRHSSGAARRAVRTSVQFRWRASRRRTRSADRAAHAAVASQPDTPART